MKVLEISAEPAAASGFVPCAQCSTQIPAEAFDYPYWTAAMRLVSRIAIYGSASPRSRGGEPVASHNQRAPEDPPEPDMLSLRVRLSSPKAGY